MHYKRGDRVIVTRLMGLDRDLGVCTGYEFIIKSVEEDWDGGKGAVRVFLDEQHESYLFAFEQIRPVEIRGVDMGRVVIDEYTNLGLMARIRAKRAARHG